MTSMCVFSFRFAIPHQPRRRVFISFHDRPTSPVAEFSIRFMIPHQPCVSACARSDCPISDCVLIRFCSLRRYQAHCIIFSGCHDRTRLVEMAFHSNLESRSGKFRNPATNHKSSQSQAQRADFPAHTHTHTHTQLGRGDRGSSSP